MLALFAVYWIVVVVILLAARQVFDQVAGLTGDQRAVEVAIVLALTALLGLLSAGVVRGWRWTFWLILVAFLAGVLRAPVAVLELAGRVHSQGPRWYVALTAVVGLAQFGIAVAMLAGHRRAGIWGDP